jgi:hypothetical protein
MEIIHRTRANAEAMRVQELCLVVLRQLSILDPECSTSLSSCDQLLAHCFRILKSTTLTSSACDLIEHILLSRNDLVLLDSFSNIVLSVPMFSRLRKKFLEFFQSDFARFCSSLMMKHYRRLTVSSLWRYRT